MTVFAFVEEGRACRYGVQKGGGPEQPGGKEEVTFVLRTARRSDQSARRGPRPAAGRANIPIMRSELGS